MKPIDSENLRHPDENLKINGGVQIGEDVPSCPACNTKLDFTEIAMEEIAFVRMCEVTQTLFDCPH